MQKGRMSAKGGSAFGGKNKKGNVAVIAIVIVIVAIITGVITWLVATKTQAPTQQAAVTQPTPATKTQPATQPVDSDETANWQAYSNEKFGFQIKYIKDLDLDVNDFTDSQDKRNFSDNPAISSWFIDINKAKDGDKLFELQLGQSDSTKTRAVVIGGFINFNIEKTKYSDVNNWLAVWKKNTEKPSSYEGATMQPKIASTKDIVISGINGKVLSLEGFQTDKTKVVFIKNGFLYNITFGALPGEDSASVKTANANFEKTLNTFKFTN